MAEDQQQEGNVPEVDAAMQKAMDDGWVNQETWIEQGKDPALWTDHIQFNVKGELMGRISEQSGVISTQNATIGELKSTVQDLVKMQDKIAEREYDRIMSQLKQQKAIAINESNGEAVAEIEDQMDNLKAQRDELVTKPKTKTEAPQSEGNQQAQSLHPEVQAWISSPENAWYSKDPRMQTLANGIAAEIAQSNPGMAPGAVLRKMEAEVRKEMPHKFRTSSVDTGNGGERPSTSRKRGYKDLTPEQQKTCDRFIKTEAIKNVDEYIKQLEAIGE